MDDIIDTFPKTAIPTGCFHIGTRGILRRLDDGSYMS
jgi:hypothetical protein